MWREEIVDQTVVAINGEIKQEGNTEEEKGGVEGEGKEEIAKKKNKGVQMTDRC